ncbi:MAG: 2-amino-4-hydroxy-6-hydroxymethyldihydropteridine diphosphokinase [Candidatus Omnitrophica bacterium]|nr:2-amino-4-hydroxy-6-hydroxymethyldihydropteridine diphosphokinase [Candidatus Omnitrophota bacterium]MDD5080603.1 2-amino-4-hydroxy-6-hydroxymethyldihydropteridine diphosphokinase [Candidatus Omnitrophota bacterium]MDD5441122.1 2-amino-4-hydroxy-6-hydroxymethyldihydropteridine diphosphokinase [Candidatus Omnitrophota bacterium]
MGIGSNLGDRYDNIAKAVKYIKANGKITVSRVSPLIETDPVGGPLQGKYINGVIELTTELSADELLNVLAEIEDRLGRKRSVKNAPRTIDLDILLFDAQRINTKNLKVPHPLMCEREFVMSPLRQLCPDIDAFIKKIR